MKRLIIAIVAVLTMAMAGSAIAATATNSLQVSASAVPSCRFDSVTNVAFGDYDPTNVTATDATGDIRFRCTKNTNYQTYITGTRTMVVGGDTLNFELYSDAPGGTLYPSANPGITGTAANNSTITRSVYGRIPALQDVAAGSYSRTLTATVEY